MTRTHRYYRKSHCKVIFIDIFKVYIHQEFSANSESNVKKKKYCHVQGYKPRMSFMILRENNDRTIEYNRNIDIPTHKFDKLDLSALL